MIFRRILTVSAVLTFLACEARYEYSYTYRLKPRRFSSALETGSAAHAGHEAIANGLGLDAALEAVDAHIVAALEQTIIDPRFAEETADRAETARRHARAMVRARLDVLGPLDFVATERSMRAPLCCDGRKSRTFDVAGKCDGQVAAGSPADVLTFELKTTSEEVGRVVEGMRHGVQIPVYQYLAEHSGARSVGAIVEVWKKPTVRRFGVNGKRTAPESWDDYEERCYRQIYESPDRFFAREELPDDASQRRDTLALFWQVAAQIRRCDREGYRKVKGPPPVSPCTFCSYRRVCWYDDLDGYDFAEHAHEELDIEEG